jgi:hypothetical protein
LQGVGVMLAMTICAAICGYIITTICAAICDYIITTIRDDKSDGKKG